MSSAQYRSNGMRSNLLYRPAVTFDVSEGCSGEPCRVRPRPSAPRSGHKEVCPRRATRGYAVVSFALHSRLMVSTRHRREGAQARIRTASNAPCSTLHPSQSATHKGAHEERRTAPRGLSAHRGQRSTKEPSTRRRACAHGHPSVTCRPSISYTKPRRRSEAQKSARREEGRCPGHRQVPIPRPLLHPLIHPQFRAGPASSSHAHPSVRPRAAPRASASPRIRIRSTDTAASPSRVRVRVSHPVSSKPRRSAIPTSPVRVRALGADPPPASRSFLYRIARPRHRRRRRTGPTRIASAP